MGDSTLGVGKRRSAEASVIPRLQTQLSGKSEKVFPGDPVLDADVYQGSSTDLAQLADGSLDLVITDPPFGGLLHYSELSDFFYVWLRLALKEQVPRRFSARSTRPKSLEAVANRAREPEDPDGFYQRLLTAVLARGASHPEAQRHPGLHLPPQRGRTVGGSAGVVVRRGLLPRSDVSDPLRRDQGRRRVRLQDHRVRHHPRLPQAHRRTQAGELGPDAPRGDGRCAPTAGDAGEPRQGRSACCRHSGDPARQGAGILLPPLRQGLCR